MEQVVLFDPAGEYAAGEVLEGNVAEMVARRGAMLPVEAAQRRINAHAAFVRTSPWGEGWVFDPAMPRMGAPAVMYVVADRPLIHWFAMLHHTGPNPRCSLRLTSDTSQRQVLSGGLSSEALSEVLRVSDARSALRGRSRLSAANEGYYGFALYGTATDCVVEWVAMTQTM